MKVTTRKWKNNYGCPPLWDVLINGNVIGSGDHSAGRVLKMGRSYLPILDGVDLFGSCDTRKEAAEIVASFVQEG